MGRRERRREERLWWGPVRGYAQKGLVVNRLHWWRLGTAEPWRHRLWGWGCPFHEHHSPSCVPGTGPKDGSSALVHYAIFTILIHIDNLNHETMSKYISAILKENKKLPTHGKQYSQARGLMGDNLVPLILSLLSLMFTKPSKIPNTAP